MNINDPAYVEAMKRMLRGRQEDRYREQSREGIRGTMPRPPATPSPPRDKNPMTVRASAPQGFDPSGLMRAIPDEADMADYARRRNLRTWM